jgi:hypothetical protein
MLGAIQRSGKDFNDLANGSPVANTGIEERKLK